MKTLFSHLLLSLLLALGLQGCSLGKTWREIYPEGADQEVKARYGFFSLQHIPSGTSKLILRAQGMPMPVRFATSTAAEDCRGWAEAGTVPGGGDGAQSPAMTRMSAIGPDFLELSPTPEQPIQVRAHSHGVAVPDSVPQSGAHTVSSDSCGTLVARFTPQADHGYVARLVLQGRTSCQLVVEDTTNPDLPVPADAQPVLGCWK